MKKQICYKYKNKGAVEAVPLFILLVIGVLGLIGLAVINLVPYETKSSEGSSGGGGGFITKQIGVVMPVDDPQYGRLIKAVELDEVDYFNEEAVWQGGTTLYVKVYDQDMIPLPGAMVTLSGCGAYGSQATSSGSADRGVATFNGVVFRLSMGTQTSNVNIRATKSGYGDGSCQLPVTRGPNGDRYVFNS